MLMQTYYTRVVARFITFLTPAVSEVPDDCQYFYMYGHLYCFPPGGWGGWGDLVRGTVNGWQDIVVGSQVGAKTWEYL